MLQAMCWNPSMDSEKTASSHTPEPVPTSHPPPQKSKITLAMHCTTDQDPSHRECHSSHIGDRKVCFSQCVRDTINGLSQHSGVVCHWEDKKNQLLIMIIRYTVVSKNYSILIKLSCPVNNMHITSIAIYILQHCQLVQFSNSIWILGTSQQNQRFLCVWKSWLEFPQRSSTGISWRFEESWTPRPHRDTFPVDCMDISDLMSSALSQ